MLLLSLTVGFLASVATATVNNPNLSDDKIVVRATDLPDNLAEKEVLFVVFYHTASSETPRRHLGDVPNLSTAPT